MVAPPGKENGASAARIAELLELPAPELPARCPVRSLRVFRAAFADDPALIQVLPAALNRRRSGEFDPEHSQQLYRLVRVWLTALGVFQNPDRTRSFLTGPHAMLQGRSPLQCAAKSEEALLRVESVLGRLHYGSVA